MHPRSVTSARRAPEMRVSLSSRRTSAVVCDGTGDTRTPYAVEAMGDGRNSAMSRKTAGAQCAMALQSIWHFLFFLLKPCCVDFRRWHKPNSTVQAAPVRL